MEPEYLPAVIELEGVTKRYDGAIAVDALDLMVGAGELLVLCGGSGCGKTTTLKTINRLIEPDAGRIRIEGRDTRDWAGFELRRHVGYCFQQVGLFPHMTVAENVAVTPRLLGWDAARVSARVDALLELVQLEPARYRGRLPEALSGGQQQRVGIARALAAEPGVLLMDEPFGALDPITRDHLQARFQEIRHELGVTTVFVTHDMAEALVLGDRIAVMEAGRLVQVGAPRELLAAPADARVAELLAVPRRQAEQVEALLHGSGP
ncbi:MAG: ATP-binding cassette domain-containing protein [Myxococcota bacterium]|nr:ATP-binding cassette domain-containing protein [Myxococcota bacterium]